jgi:glutamate/tyrosine decarboxylase-like PLP-dependent enzyme
MRLHYISGVITAGGTESLIDAMLVYRERGRREKGITRPEVILPTTAHVALAKAAHLLGIDLRYAPVRDDYLVDVGWVRDHVTENTVALVGSAGSYPYALIDPIEELAAIALERDLGLHVDACMGGHLAAADPGLLRPGLGRVDLLAVMTFAGVLGAAILPARAAARDRAPGRSDRCTGRVGPLLHGHCHPP